MNIENLKLVRQIVEKTPQSEFDMKVAHSDPKTNRHCVGGLIAREFMKPRVSGHESQFILDFVGLDRYNDMDKMFYLFNVGWGRNPESNTIEHALYRIDRLLEGYEPQDIYVEIANEKKRLTQITLTAKHHDVYYFKDQYNHEVHFELEDAIDLSSSVQIDGDEYTSIIVIEYDEVKEAYLLFASFDSTGNVESVTLRRKECSTLDSK